jgi:hypothetical protein
LVDWLVGNDCEHLESHGVDSLMGELIKSIVYPSEQEREAAFARLAVFLKRKGASQRTVAILTRPHPDDVKPVGDTAQRKAA